MERILVANKLKSQNKNVSTLFEEEIDSTYFLRMVTKFSYFIKVCSLWFCSLTVDLAFIFGINFSMH